jgi:hypothetical protein
MVFRAGNPAARIRSSDPDESLAETFRSKTAARYSSWDQPASRACSARRRALSWIRGAFERPSEEIDLLDGGGGHEVCSWSSKVTPNQAS